MAVQRLAGDDGVHLARHPLEHGRDGLVAVDAAREGERRRGARDDPLAVQLVLAHRTVDEPQLPFERVARRLGRALQREQPAVHIAPVDAHVQLVDEREAHAQMRLQEGVPRADAVRVAARDTVRAGSLGE